MAKMDLRGWARMGAQRRLADIQSEMQSIIRTFPELTIGRQAREAVPKAIRRRGSVKWSAAKRKAVSERMKKYWAARRKSKS